MTRLFRVVFCLCLANLVACSAEAPLIDDEDEVEVDDFGLDFTKGDTHAELRDVEVILTDPHCDVCTSADKEALKQRAQMTGRVIELIEAAGATIDVAQFTFSVREIEAALIAAHERGVRVRLAMNHQQQFGDNVSNRLKDAGLDVTFVEGKNNGTYSGLQHAKFMIVDGSALITGSNNWSSTGTTINEENALLIRSVSDDPLLVGFQCHFDAMLAGDLDGAGRACSNELVAFTPSTAPIAMIKAHVREATESVDVLMHHLVFKDLVKVLAQAAERGIRVRVLVNEADREEHSGGRWDRLFAAGGQIRFKRVNPDLYQLMHHKLAIIDGHTLLNGSGNWSGSAFFNNYENYMRIDTPSVVRPFREKFTQLWIGSRTASSLDRNLTLAQQHAELAQARFGNLHAHIALGDAPDVHDDGKPERHDMDGNPVPVDVGQGAEGQARFAYEYARDRGQMDFLAITPHTVDDTATDAPDIPSCSEASYEGVLNAAETVSAESAGFVAMAGMEWSTNSTGNHVNILGSRAIAKVERGNFYRLYEDFLPGRARDGDMPLLMLNHPRTFRENEEFITGNWDQIFGINLQDITNNSQRTKKFNDYGLDDYSPMREVLPTWIDGSAMPDPAVVDETLDNIWRASSAYTRLMEVTIGRGTDIGHEHSQNPSLSENDAGELERRTKVHDDWDYYLLHGFQLAPAASHDNHLANWGTGHSSRTILYSEQLNELELLEAIDRRDVAASEDENMELRFYADDRVPMGGTITTFGGSIQGSFTVYDPDYNGGLSARVFRGRVGDSAVEEVQSLSPVIGGEVRFDMTTQGAGTHFFYVEVHELDSNRMAWTAPIWVRHQQQ